MKVATGLRMNEADHIAVPNELEWRFRIELWLSSVRVKEPVIIGVLVVVASDLLLRGAFGISLNVRMKKTTSITHILQRRSRAEGNLERAVFANLCAF
jgi:hypothetical protein